MHRIVRYLSGFLLLFSGCCLSLSEEEQRENLMEPLSLDLSLERSLATPFFGEGEWPTRAWWEELNFPQLNDLIALALVQNPKMDQIERRIEYAWQEANIARARLFPSIYFNATDDYQYLSKNGLYRAFNPNIPLSANLIDLKLNFSYEFDIWEKFPFAYGSLRPRESRGG